MVQCNCRTNAMIQWIIFITSWPIGWRLIFTLTRFQQCATQIHTMMCGSCSNENAFKLMHFKHMNKLRCEISTPNPPEENGGWNRIKILNWFTYIWCHYENIKQSQIGYSEYKSNFHRDGKEFSQEEMDSCMVRSLIFMRNIWDNMIKEFVMDRFYSIFLNE